MRASILSASSLGISHVWELSARWLNRLLFAHIRGFSDRDAPIVEGIRRPLMSNSEVKAPAGPVSPALNATFHYTLFRQQLRLRATFNLHQYTLYATMVYPDRLFRKAESTCLTAMRRAPARWIRPLFAGPRREKRAELLTSPQGVPRGPSLTLDATWLAASSHPIALHGTPLAASLASSPATSRRARDAGRLWLRGNKDCDSACIR